MRKFLLALLFLFPTPALAFDCSVDPVACRCIGVIYKDPLLSAPNDLTLRVMNWQRAGKRLNRRLIDQTLVVVFYSWEEFGLHVCCNVIDNRGVPAPWDNITVTWIEADAGEKDQVLFGEYDAAPEAADWVLVENGEDGAATITISEIANGQEVTALSGDSRGIPLSKNDTLINRARNNRGTALRDRILDNGCALP